MATLPDYAELQRALLNVDANMEAAESHGALCGMMCAQGAVEISSWIQHVLGDQDNANLLVAEVSRDLQALYQTSLQQMNDEVADLQLLLADDDEPLSERVHSLAYWCQGFVYGLAAGGLKQDSKLPADSAELLTDLIEIARAVHDSDEDEETDEESYMQLVEYVRVGVLLINEELQPLKSNQQIH